VSRTSQQPRPVRYSRECAATRRNSSTATFGPTSPSSIGCTVRTELTDRRVRVVDFMGENGGPDGYRANRAARPVGACR